MNSLLQYISECKLVLLALGMLSFAGLTFGQSPITWSLTSKDGLPSNIIYKIHQDSFGHMWIATDNGVCKYDGSSFEQIEIEPLNDHFFAFMDQDTFGNLWMLNISGELFVNVNGNIEYKSVLSEMKNSYIRNIVITGSNLWLAVKHEEKKSTDVICYKIASDGSLEFQSNMSNHNSTIQAIVNCKDEMYMSYNVGGKFYLSKMNTDCKYTWTQEIDHVVFRLVRLNEDFLLGLSYHDNAFHLIGPHGSKRFDYSGVNVKQLVLAGDKPSILTDSGFHFLSFSSDTIILSKPILSGLDINYLTQCDEGLLWLATSNEGIKVIPNLNNLYYELKDESRDISNITSIHKLGEVLYVGTNGGSIYCIKNGQADWLGNIDEDVKKIDSYNGRIYFGNSKGLWTYDDGLFSLVTNAITKDFIVVNDTTAVVSMSYQTVLKSLKNKGLAIPLNGSQYVNRSYAVAQDNRGIIWVGNIKGLYCYNSEASDSINAINLLPYNISDIEIINDSVSYVSTFANGVYKFVDYELDSQMSLPTDKILDMHAEDNNLVMASEKGAILYDIEDNDFQLYSSYNYLPITNVECVYLDGPQLWIGGEDGLSMINLAGSVDSFDVQIKLEKFSISGVEIPLDEDYVFDYGSNNLVLDFSAVVYSKPDELTYQYMVEGMDTSWISTKISEVRLSSMVAGDYNIKVRVTDGMQFSELYMFPFKVKKAWYTHWLARLIVIASLLGIGYWVSKLISKKRMQDQEIEAETQRKLAGMKMTALQNHMNPHFISNALYSIQDMIENNKNWEASEYTANFADLIRRSMRYATTERITLAQELDFLKVYLDLETARTGSVIQVQLNLDPYLLTNKNDITIPPLLVQPLLENCFKHANLNAVENPTLIIDFKHLDEAIYCTIKDNGIGFHKVISKEKKYTLKSTGIDTVRRRLELNAKQFGNDELNLVAIDSKVMPERNSGTKITIRVDY